MSDALAAKDSRDTAGFRPLAARVEELLPAVWPDICSTPGFFPPDITLQRSTRERQAYRAIMAAARGDFRVQPLRRGAIALEYFATEIERLADERWWTRKHRSGVVSRACSSREKERYRS